MSGDFYYDEVLSGRAPVMRIAETANVLAFRHTRPAYPAHIIAIPKRPIDSLLALEDHALLGELFVIIKEVAAQMLQEHGACRVVTNLGSYQESNHLHWHLISGERLSK